MIRPVFAIIRLRKFLLGSFAFFCFCQTSYAEKKLEASICFFLKHRLPDCTLEGLKALSISRWHIETLSFHNQIYGDYEAKDLLCEIKLAPLFFGKISLKNLLIQSLNITPNPDAPLSLEIFNKIYLSKFLSIDQVFFSEVRSPILYKPVTVQFQKKPLLNFCKIYDLAGKNRIFFEIPRKSRFLRFKTTSQFNIGDLVLSEMSGEGFVSQTSHIDLDGFCELKGCDQKIPIEAKGDLSQGLSFEGYFLSDLLKGYFQIKPGSCTADLTFTDLKELFPQSGFSGDCSLEVSGPFNKISFKALSDHLYYKRKALGPLKITGSFPEQHLLKIQGKLLKNTRDEILFSSTYSPENETLKLAIQSQILTSYVKASWQQKELEQLVFQARSSNLKFFETLFDDLNMKGEANLVCHYSKSQKLLQIFSALNQIQIGSFSLYSGSLALKDSPSAGNCKMHLNRLNTPFYEPISIDLSATRADSWDVQTILRSKNFDLSAFHEFAYDKMRFSWQLQDLSGHFFEHPAMLNKPLQISKSNDQIEIKPFELSLGSSQITGYCHLHNHLMKADLQIDPIPLQGVKLPYFNAPIHGFLKAQFHYDHENLKSSFLELEANDLSLLQNSKHLPPVHFFTKGWFLKDQMHYQSKLLFANDDFCLSQGVLSSFLSKNKGKSFHNLSCKIHLSDLGQYVNLGSNSLGGTLLADLSLSKEFSRTLTTGCAKISNLHCGFPLIGMYLDEGTLMIKPEGEKAQFELKINDLDKGSAEAKGLLNLKDFSYQADVSFKNIFLNFKNMFQSRVYGLTHCDGNFKKIKALGSLQLSDSQYLLKHDQLSKNKIYKIEKIAQDLPRPPKDPFDFSLNFDLNTQNNLKVRGLGLESEWRGQSHCLIKNNHFSLKGLLSCTQGLYRFQTKKFMIDEGTIQLSDDGPSTILAKGHLDIPSHQIKVNLNGPLNAPKIHFSSLPALNEQSIFSYILFNKPLTQLHPFQSIELAQTLLEISGDKNPFSLSKIRANLSVDSLDIRADEEDENSLTVHVGKYIFPKLLVGLTQSKSSSDMMLQWEFNHGFMLKAESQKQKEGKFSLKWNKTF